MWSEAGLTVETDASVLLSDDDWESLYSTVAQGQCTLMLGPGTVTGRFEGQQMPAHVAFATFATQRLAALPNPPRLDLLDPNKPGAVAQVALAREDPLTIGRWIKDFYEVFDVDRDVLDDLAALPFPLVVNTSPGISVHQAFADAKPGTCKESYDIHSTQPKMMAEPSVGAPVIYHLYGIADRPQSMILSDSDQLDFVVAVAKNNPPLPKNLTSQMHDVDRTLLFLGFDLADWQFRILLHVLARDVSRRYKSFAFELDADPVDPATRDFYLNSHKIHFFSGEIPRFAKELRARVEKMGVGLPGDGTTAPPVNAPVVFLCHANEDKDRAERLAEDLHRNGLRTWFDKDDLRGGDRWDDLIQNTLMHDVQYVVVLQSESLAVKSRTRSYVNREIKIALKVQEFYASPRRFVIPAMLDGPERQRDDLEHIQSVDLNQPDGVDRLVRTIKRDIEEQRVR